MKWSLHFADKRLVMSCFSLSQQRWVMDLRQGGYCQPMHTQPRSSEEPLFSLQPLLIYLPFARTPLAAKCMGDYSAILKCQFPETRNRMEKGSEFTVQAHRRWLDCCLSHDKAIKAAKGTTKHFLKSSDSSFLNDQGKIPAWLFIKLKWGEN